MHNPPLSMVTCALALALGCKSCTDDGPGTSSNPGPAREQQTDLAQLRSRLAARRLDRNKAYPKGEDGSIACGTDPDCFLVQSERCVKAVVMHTDTLSAYGLVEKIEARYRILGGEGNKCKLVRDTLALSANIDGKWIEMLKQKGIPHEQTEQIRSNALETLREGNPDRLECLLTPDQMLEVGVNLTDNHYDPQFWRLACSVTAAPNPPP